LVNYEEEKIMKFVIQRVKEATVKVDGETVGSIAQGLLVFVGISNSDDFRIADKMIDKMTKLRIFEDENGKTNLSISDVGGEFLIISQFTLYADCKKGNRPSFINAGKPEMANELYEYIISEVNKKDFKTEHGIFGADMQVSLINDGPFTILLDSSEII
jgi:D-tyrosyl-tRNA(Tyr) deacylase